MTNLGMVLRAAIVVVGLIGSVTACGSDSGTDPFAPNGTAPAGGAPAGGGPSHATPEVFKVDACTMVPKDVLSELGFTEPGKGTFKPDTPDEDRSGNLCSWSRRSSAPGLTIFISTGAPGAGRPADATPPTESTLDGRKTFRYTDESKNILGSCNTTIVVAPNVKVVVQADGMDTLAHLCGRVDKVLPAVSEKIPG